MGTTPALHPKTVEQLVCVPVDLGMIRIEYNHIIVGFRNSSETKYDCSKLLKKAMGFEGRNICVSRFQKEFYY